MSLVEFYQFEIINNLLALAVCPVFGDVVFEEGLKVFPFTIFGDFLNSILFEASHIRIVDFKTFVSRSRIEKADVVFSLSETFRAGTAIEGIAIEAIDMNIDTPFAQIKCCFIKVIALSFFPVSNLGI